MKKSCAITICTPKSLVHSNMSCELWWYCSIFFLWTPKFIKVSKLMLLLHMFCETSNITCWHNKHEYYILRQNLKGMLFIIEETILICPCLQSQRGLWWMKIVKSQKKRWLLLMTQSIHVLRNKNLCVPGYPDLNWTQIPTVCCCACYQVHNFVTISRRDV